MAVFIFDIGKTNLKCHVLDDRGKSVWSVTRENRTASAPPYPHFALDDIWEWLLQALTEAGSRFALKAINISTHGACAVLLDGAGELLFPVMDYEWEGLDDDSDHYDAKRPDFEQTFSPRLPAGLNLGRQLWWLKSHRPRDFARLDTLLFYPQYWAWKLSGEAVTERTSLGCHTDLWCPAVNDFSSLVDALDMREAVPPLVDNRAPVGTLLPAVARCTGLSSDCLVFPGVHDSNASLASHLHGRARSHLTVVSAGTWIITMANGSGLDTLSESRDMLANVNVLGEPVACARFMGGREFEHICAQTGATLEEPVCAHQIEQLIAEGLFALPGFVQGSGPFADRPGQISAPTGHGKALATLYTALMIDTELSLLNAAGDVIFGSTSKKNPLICQLLAQLRPRQRILLSGEAASTVRGCWALTCWDQPAAEDLQEVAAPAGVAGLERYREAWLRQLQDQKARIRCSPDSQP